MIDHRPARVGELRRALLSQHVDAMVVTSLPNIRYLTGFSGSNALVVVSQQDVVLLTDFRYKDQSATEVGALARVIIEPLSLWARLWQVLPELRSVERMGFESAHLLHRDFQRLLEQGSRWTWRPLTDVVETLRMVKDATEVARIRVAGEIAVRALERTLPQVHAGLSELQVAGLLEHALRDEGSEGFPFETIVAAGARAALPHARATENRIEPNDFLLIDFGAVHEGYCSDITRTVVVGRAAPDQVDAYEIVRGAQAQAVAGVRGGMTGRDADALARSYIERAGWGEAFGHSLGHGIGLEVHEAPRLARTTDTPLPEGAVVTIEPGVYRTGWGGVRIEDDVLLTADGSELLTHFPRQLLEIA
jgi:Xaa-Pro aminopeptidase